jgi:hypothetical protein
MTSRSIEDYRARNGDAPLDLVRKSDAWKPVVRLINGWSKEKLSSRSGYSIRELDHFSRTQGVRFPSVLREWWRLAGHHSFMTPGVLRGIARFLGPDDSGLLSRRDFLAIVVDDTQTWSCNGIHADYLADPEPAVHGINGTISPDDAPRVNWYKGSFITTGLRVPSLIFTTLLYHLSHPSPLVRDEAVYMQLGQRTPGGTPDERLISKLGLKRFPNNTIVGDIYSDGEEVIYYWLSGFACRSAGAAERVLSAVSGRPSSRSVGPPAPTSK